jgi:hypothetical protein
VKPSHARPVITASHQVRPLGPGIPCPKGHEPTTGRHRPRRRGRGCRTARTPLTCHSYSRPLEPSHQLAVATHSQSGCGPPRSASSARTPGPPVLLQMPRIAAAVCALLQTRADYTTRRGPSHVSEPIADSGRRRGTSCLCRMLLRSSGYACALGQPAAACRNCRRGIRTPRAFVYPCRAHVSVNKRS